MYRQAGRQASRQDEGGGLQLYFPLNQYAKQLFFANGQRVVLTHSQDHDVAAFLLVT